MCELLYWATLMDGRITIPRGTKKEKRRMKLRSSQVGPLDREGGFVYKYTYIYLYQWHISPCVCVCVASKDSRERESI